MIQNYFSGIVEQVFSRIGEKDHNVSLAKYSNDFSISRLDIPDRLKVQSEIYYTSYEYKPGKITGAYEPFLDIIKELFERYGDTGLDQFMERCKVYRLQQPIIKSYIQSGHAKRAEQLLMGETEYERERMTEGIMNMLIGLSELHPFILIINRMQLAARSTVVLINRLMKNEHAQNIGIVLGMNELQHVPEYMIPEWDAMEELLEDRNQVFRIGSAGIVTTEKNDGFRYGINSEGGWEETVTLLENMVGLLDFEQANFYLQQLERKIRFENYVIADEDKFPLLAVYAYASIYSGDLSKAIELTEEIKGMKLTEHKKFAKFASNYLAAVTYMYQGKLPEAIANARICRDYAMDQAQEDWQFASEVLEVQAKMSGWCNIFFCAQDIAVPGELIEKLRKHNYMNHMAHIYIYAYDNDPQIVAKAFQADDELVYFNKGIELAKEIGNERLIYSAYQKNIMLTSTNGMHDISTMYSVLTFEDLGDKGSMECGRIYSGLGYNLSALGRNQEAKRYFAKAIQVFYELNLPEDIAEVYYNMALNCIGLEDYREANEDLMLCMSAIEKLHLNSLRVCNLSKLYGLLALCNQKIGNCFNCEQYLNNCKQFLNYVFEKENSDDEITNIHDYAKCDDDMFLYYFSLALLEEEEEDDAKAYECYETAQKHLMCAEGNQFFCYRLFRKSRIGFFEKTGRKNRIPQEREYLDRYEDVMNRPELDEKLRILDVVEEYLRKDKSAHFASPQELGQQLRQESLNRAYKTKKSQMDFISAWQKLLDVTDVSAKQLLDTAMKSFLYHFSVDKAVYIQYHGGEAEVLYNNTGCILTDQPLDQLKTSFEENQRGFAVSKISNNYAEHMDIVSVFGEDNVCSMVAIPFINNGTVESILIVYVEMKDNWHSSVSRYMLDEDDKNMYELLFREVLNALKRLNAYEKIYEMNTMLYRSAVTDQLTGIYNRKGFYQNIERVLAQIKKGELAHRFGLMFIDLDNFKGYNDTFGHDIGDLILRSMSDIFTEVCGKNGFVCRYGGDEFILFLYTDDRAILESMAKRIYDRIDESKGFVDVIAEQIGEAVSIEEGHKISCSIGIIASNQVQNEEDVNQMVKQADDLLYTIKTTTKGRYTFL